MHEGDDEAIVLASHWLCEECSDLWFSLYELGFQCVTPNENVRDLVRQYAELYGPASRRDTHAAPNPF